jgi:thiamine biosynthesis lipoprotein
MTWQRVPTGDATVAVAERAALGTTARVAVWPPAHAAAACAAVDGVLGALDLQASRFRPDSELSWLHQSGDGMFLISDGLAEAISVALAAARWTGGLTDPTVGAALIGLGYDRDFAAIASVPGGPAPPAPPASLAQTGPAPGWQRIALDGRLLRLPPGVLLDLGATAKGVGADRAAAAVMSAAGHRGGALVSLGGDIATGGTPPQGGWPVTVAETPDQAGWQSRQVIRIAAGAVATSSAGYRRWRRGGREMHHIVDPRTGWPAGGPWRTVSAAAATCADANAATTAAIVAGPDAADWLAGTGLPARLTGYDGRVLLLGGWPAAAGERLPRLAGSHVYRGTRVPADHQVTR